MATKVFNKTILQTSFTSLESIYYLLQTVKDNQPMSSADGKDFIFPQARAKISQARGGEWSEDKRDTHAELTLAEMKFIRYTDETKNSFEVSDMGNAFLSSFNLNMNANDEGKYNLVLEDKLCLQDKNQLLFDILTGIKVDQPKYGRKIRPYLILFKLLVDSSLNGYISKSEWACFINNSSFVSDYQYEEIKSAALYVRQNNAVVEPQKSDRILTRLVLWKVLDRYVIGKDNSNYFTINPDFLTTIKYNFYMTGNIADTSKLPSSNPQKGYMQKIYYGAPGTGKSNEIKILTGEDDEHKRFAKNFTYRTTFHPDSDYSTFVGAYKPISSKSYFSPVISQSELDVRFQCEVDILDRESIFAFGRKYWKTLETLDVELKEVLFADSYLEEKNTKTLKEGLSAGRNQAFGDGSKIIYEYRPQTFLKAYIKAWSNPNKQIALVIEEINRGNCAQIFGDIFQLLDREANGLSKYPIESDIDMQEYILNKFKRIGSLYENEEVESINSYYKKHYDDAFNQIMEGKILALPKNLCILATMNTSDQSLFPMDSAFKRRWDWEYMPIKNAHKNWKIQLDNSHELIDWWEFLNRINMVISDLTTSEDKQLGYFFCQPDEYQIKPDGDENAQPDLITAKHFVGKVIFYLWNDVFKDYAFDAPCCKGKDDKEVLFAKFYNEDGKSVNIDTLTNFFESLKTDDEDSLVKTKKSNADEAGKKEENNSTNAGENQPDNTLSPEE